MSVTFISLPINFGVSDVSIFMLTFSPLAATSTFLFSKIMEVTLPICVTIFQCLTYRLVSNLSFPSRISTPIIRGLLLVKIYSGIILSLQG